MRTVRTTMVTALAVASLLSGGLIVPAHAELKAMGQINPSNGFPVWYQDTGNVSLDLCLDPNDVLCLQPMPIPNAQQAVSFPGNFPEEAFWWTGGATIPLATGGQALLTLAMEGAFANGPPEAGAQISFGRIRVNVDTPVTGTYTVTHPYGVMVFNVTDTVAGIKNQGRDIGATGPQFTGILDPVNNDVESVVTPDMFRFGPYLRWTDPDFPVVDQVTGKRYMGNPNIPHAVTGSPFGTNYFRIDGPPGSNIGGSNVDFVETSLFDISGRIIGLGVTPFPAASVTTVVGTPADIPVTVTNITGTPVAFGANPFAITGPNNADFTVINDTCSSITLLVPPATPDSCVFTIRFNPASSVSAQRNATVTLTPTDENVAPPVSLSVTGTAKYLITPATSTSVTGTGTRVAGTISPSTPQEVNAGGAASFTLTPDSGYFPRVLVDGAHTPITNNTLSFSGLSAHRTFDVKFVRNGDLVEDGIIGAGDALRAMQVALGIGATATPDEMVAADVGPLVSSKPTADGSTDVSDVLMILRRAVGLDPAW